jgi:hypothetical protein
MISMEFTQEEYRKLCEIFFLGDWMVNAHKVVDSKSTPYHALEQKILGRAAAAGCGDLVDYDDKGKTFFPSQGLEEKCNEVVEEHEDCVFWEELMARMAERDVYGSTTDCEGGEEAMEKRFSAIGEKEEFYNKEFIQNGIKRLHIVDSLVRRTCG